MSTRLAHHATRQRTPELEAEFNRSPALGYETKEEAGFIRCLDHGYPTCLARWHCHEEYEFHIIVATSGKAFVGDWIGAFSPGHVVLCGPRLPHNWISTDLDGQAVERRDLVIQFPHEPIERGCQSIGELGELKPLLERSRHGIEFFGFAEPAEAHWRRIKATRGLPRLTAFLELMHELTRWTDYRLLSNVQMQGGMNDAEFDQINAITQRIADDLTHPISAADVAAELGMSESRFSRFFRRATGNTFSGFVNRVRINRACQLLMNSERYITSICYDVGFNNVANFNRRFLEIKGITPSEFRRQAESRFSG